MSEARHLLQRTGFGASADEMVAIAPLTREEAVDRLLASLDRPDLPVPPPFLALPRPNYWATGWEERDMVLQRVAERDQMQVAWIGHMIATRTPFAERLALFWHGHFVSRFDPGRVSAPMFDQIALFRREGGGNLRQLLRDVLRDPMMLTSLDNVWNTKSHPNENLARELMELFTLGIGHYDQHDVTEVARALAGHGVNFDGGWTYRYAADEADDGEKHVLGQVIAAKSGDNIDRLVDILLAQPQAADLIAAKFYSAFVSIRPDPEASGRLAAVLRDHGYNLKPFLRALLLSPEFWSPDHRGDLVKSPIDLVVGFCRTFGLMPDDVAVLVAYLDKLGQTPFMAPSVAGWREGTAWLNMKTLAYRQTVLSRLWDAIEVADRRPKPGDLAIRFSAQFITTPTTFKVKVNGVDVATVTQTIGLNLQNQRSRGETTELKPMWETAIVPAGSLLGPVRSVEVIHISGDPDSQLFVNWVEVNGLRYPPQLGRWSPAAAKCADAPKGMFYCDVGLAFDIAPFDPRQATIDDLRADHNSHIEYTTARLDLPLLPLSRQSLQESLASLTTDETENREATAAQWLLGRRLSSRALSARGGVDRASRSDEIQRSVSAQPVSMPMHPAVGAAADGGDTTLADLVRAMTLDPQYNLK